MLTDELVDFRGKPLDPTKHGRAIHLEPALMHHFFKIAIRKLIPTVPSDAQEDEFGRVMVPLEGRVITLHEQSR